MQSKDQYACSQAEKMIQFCYGKSGICIKKKMIVAFLCAKVIAT
jgi:hypothetical protein